MLLMVVVQSSVALGRGPRARVADQSFFASPSRNISCELDYAEPGVPTGAFCEDTAAKVAVTMSPSGRLHVCGASCLGNGPEGEPALPYGYGITVGPFSCLSLTRGMLCRVHSGRGFMIGGSGVAYVAGSPSGGPSSTATADMTIRPGSTGVSYLGAWHLSASSSFAAAIRALGDPDRIGGGVDGVCIGVWPRLSLRMFFTSFGAGSGCDSTFSQKASIQGPAGRRHWHTSRGLRVGDPLSKLDRMYPHALHTRHARVLAYNPHDPIGTGRLDIITAQITNGRVSSFDLWLGGAGD